MIVANANGDQLLEILYVDEATLDDHRPLTHALVVAKSAQGTLLVFNARKSYWELAGGLIDPGESARTCAHRELEEESGQTCEEMRFVGVMRFLLRPTPSNPRERIELGALFLAHIERPQPFLENDETSRITWWDGRGDIGTIDAIDAKLATML